MLLRNKVQKDGKIEKNLSRNQFLTISAILVAMKSNRSSFEFLR